tara:strand:+ start:31 stop:231 length:201 start_codon:yes stop_codon:yes gene_type:complete
MIYQQITDKGKRENCYHTLLLGMFLNFRNYKGISSRESGIGRPDILMKRKYSYRTKSRIKNGRCDV